MTLPQALQDREMQKFDDTGLSPGQVAVRVSGANFSGTFSPKGLSIGGLFTTVEVNDTTWVPAPATPLAQRNTIKIINESSVMVRVNFTDTAPFEGNPVTPNGGKEIYDVQGNVVIYLRCESGTVEVGVEQLA